MISYFDEFSFVENQDLILISRNGEIKNDAFQNGEANRHGSIALCSTYALVACRIRPTLFSAMKKPTVYVSGYYE